MKTSDPRIAAKSLDWTNFITELIPGAVVGDRAGERHGSASVDEVIDHLAFFLLQLPIVLGALFLEKLLHRLALLTGEQHALARLIKLHIRQVQRLFALA